MVWQRGAFWGQCGNVFDVSVSALSLVCFGVYMADIDQELEAGLPVGEARPVGPASQNMPANWPRLAEAGGRPGFDLALVGRAGGRIGRSLRAAALHTGGLPHADGRVGRRAPGTPGDGREEPPLAATLLRDAGQPTCTHEPAGAECATSACLRGRAPPCKRRAPLQWKAHTTRACVSRRRWTSTSPPRAPRTKEMS